MKMSLNDANSNKDLPAFVSNLYLTSLNTQKYYKEVLFFSGFVFLLLKCI